MQPKQKFTSKLTIKLYALCTAFENLKRFEKKENIRYSKMCLFLAK